MNGLLIIEPSVNMRYSCPDELEGYQALVDSPDSGVRITVCAFFREGVGASCASVKVRKALPSAQGWIIGKETALTDPPASLQEFSLLHSLLLVEGYAQKFHGDTNPSFFLVRAGSWSLISNIMAWFNEGDLRLKSSVASDIVRVFQRLDKQLSCPLILRALPVDFLEYSQPRGVEDCDVISSTAKRLYAVIWPMVERLHGSKIARLPWTSEETKRACKTKVRMDELAVTDMLRERDSGACTIYRSLHLNREITKFIFRLFQDHRRKQVVFSSIVCSTRFKTFNQQGELLNVRCFRCGGIDSFLHMLDCTCAGPIPGINNRNHGPLISFICKLIEMATVHAPVWPVPVYRMAESELSLTFSVSASAGSENDAEARGGDCDSYDSLSFDGEP